MTLDDDVDADTLKTLAEAIFDGADKAGGKADGKLSKKEIKLALSSKYCILPRENHM